MRSVRQGTGPLAPNKEAPDAPPVDTTLTASGSGPLPPVGGCLALVDRFGWVADPIRECPSCGAPVSRMGRACGRGIGSFNITCENGHRHTQLRRPGERWVLIEEVDKLARVIDDE